MVDDGERERGIELQFFLSFDFVDNKLFNLLKLTFFKKNSTAGIRTRNS